MVERMVLPSELMLETPRPRRANPYGNNHEVSRKLKDGGVSLKEIARRAAQGAESGVILLALQQTHWNRVRAAQLLNISYRTLLYKIKGLGLHPAARTAQRHPGRVGTGQDPKA